MLATCDAEEGRDALLPELRKALRLELLKSPTFAPCSASFLEELLLESDQRQLAAGEMLWAKQDRCDQLLILRQGEVELLKDDGSAIFRWRSPALLGMWAFLHIRYHLAAARAVEPCECLAIQTSVLMAILRQHHLEKKHFISCAHAEATQVSDETWVCMMPELKPEEESPIPVVIRKPKLMLHRHSAPEVAEEGRLGSKKLPGIEPMTKTNSGRSTNHRILSRLRNQRPCWRRSVARLVSDGSDAESSASGTPGATSDEYFMCHENSSSTSAGRDESGVSDGPLSPASRKASRQQRVIKKWFETFDSDQNGRVDLEEFKTVTSHLCATMLWDEHQSSLLLQEIDTNGDHLVDLQEFAEWLTNVNATITVGLDGWLEAYDIADTVRPLYECFDPAGTGISKDQFLRTYRIIANSTKHAPIPDQDKADIWIRGAEEEYEALDARHDVNIDFEDFVRWQAELLKSSATPNSLIPEKVEQLAEVLKVILDIDTGARGRGLPAALQESVQKVAQLARELYLPCKDQLRKQLDENLKRTVQDPPPQREDFHWASPGHTALDHLRRECAIDLGVLLPGVRPREEMTKKDAWRVARRNSHLKNRSSTLVPGEVLMCLPGRRGEFLAWLEVPSREERRLGSRGQTQFPASAMMYT
ncbi:unnamed protein product [Effrenium voratum]|uniref:Calmodulin n=1 Tax=Effrenium voratum TaxID=2562239 RepID=A0AA36J3G7_9DINO|nr:unnamed protein product [Effrenium voratum]